MLGTSIALGVTLLFVVSTSGRKALTLWRWVIDHTGPTAYPALWRFVQGAFPLALLALGIGIWLGLAATPGMAKLAPGPVEDVNRLAEWFTLVGIVGCAMQILNFAAHRTLEYGATLPRPNRTKSPTNAVKKGPAHTSGKTATQPRTPHRQKAATKKARRSKTASTSSKPGRATEARRAS